AGVRDGRLCDVFQADDAVVGNLRTQNRLSSRLPNQLATNRGSSGNTVGVQLGAGPRDVAGLVWGGTGTALRRLRVAARDARGVAVLSRHGRQSGNGTVQIGYGN